MGARIGDKRNSYRILVGKPEGKRPLRRPKRRSEDNIKIAAYRSNGVILTGFIWLKIGASGRLLRTR
jgi:hypothetical protein